MYCGIYNLQHQEIILHRSSRWQMFKVRVVKDLANFTGKNLCWSLILIKRDSNTFFFLWNLVCFCLQCVFNRISNQYLRKQYLRISLGFSYVFEMLPRRWCQTDIFLGYTKCYVLAKQISSRQHAPWTTGVREGNFVF